MASTEAAILPQLRYLFHIRAAERAGETPQVFPLVILLHSSDAQILSEKISEVLLEVITILQRRGADILPRLTGDGVLGQPGDAAAGQQVLLYHGEFSTVSFATDIDESAFRYSVLVRRSSPHGAEQPASATAILQGAVFDSPTITPWSITASVQLKSAYVARKRATALAADPGLSKFLVPGAAVEPPDQKAGDLC
jgi:hypothetical protein